MDEKISIILEAIEIGRQRIDAAAKRIEEVTKAGTKQAAATKEQDSVLKKIVPTWAKVAAAATAAAAALVLITRHQLENIDATRKQADALGTNITKLSQLKFAAKLSAVGAEGMTAALTFLNRAIAEAGDKSSNAAKAFQLLGIRTEGLADRDPIDVLLEISDAFARTQGAAAKAEIAQALFGRGSKDMVNFLNAGSGAIREQMDLATRLGLAYSEQTGKSAEEFNDQLTILQGGLEGIVASVLGNVLPTLTQYADIVLELVKDQQAMGEVIANVTTVVQVMIEAAFGLVTAFRFLWDILANQLAVSWLNFNRVIEGGSALFNNFLTTTRNVSQAMLDLVKRVASFGEVFRLAFTGHFKEAAVAAKAALGDIASGVGGVISEVAQGNLRAAKIVIGTGVDVASNIGAATTQTINDLVATADSAGNQILRVSAAADKAAAARNGPVQGPPRPPAGQAQLGSIAALNEATKRKEIEAQLNIELLQTRGEFYQNADLLREAALLKEDEDNRRRLQEINNLSFAAADEKHRLLEQAERLHQAKVLAIEKQSLQERLHIMAAQLEAAHNTFSGIADAIKEFGGEGTTAYKVFATAAAVIDTARAAIAAYSSTVGIPYVGPILAPIAAGAAVAFGAAQIAKINGAFAEGGIVPGAPSNTDNRIAAVATGELIISAKSTRGLIGQIGMGGVGELLAGRVPFSGGFAGGYVPRVSASSFATGGLVGPGQDFRGTTVDLTLLDMRNRQDERDAMARNTALVVIDNLNRRGNRLKA